MTIRFELSARLAELTGTETEEVIAREGGTLADALRELERRLAGAEGAGPFLPGGRLHPSVLVLAQGAARRRDEGAMPLADGETVRLLLPVAGG